MSYISSFLEYMIYMMQLKNFKLFVNLNQKVPIYCFWTQTMASET